MKSKKKGNMNMAIKCAVLSAGCGCIAGCMMLSTAFSAPGNPVAKTVAADFAAQSGAKVWHYAVPPMSEIQRLPDVYPTDGTPNGVVRIVMAKDEYEPGSFLVWAPQDLGKVQFELGEFRRDQGSGIGDQGSAWKGCRNCVRGRGWSSLLEEGQKSSPSPLTPDP